MGLNWTEEQLRKYAERQGDPDALEQLASSEGRGAPQTFQEILDIVADRQRARSRGEEVEPLPDFRSKTEQRAWDQWIPTTGCVEAYFEAITVRLNSGSYKPDFVLRMSDRELWFIEVKGSWNAYASGRSSKKSLKEAAKMYWWLGRWFSLLPSKGGGWDLKEYK